MTGAGGEVEVIGAAAAVAVAAVGLQPPPPPLATPVNHSAVVIGSSL